MYDKDNRKLLLGVNTPMNFSRLKALHKLRVVNVARAKRTRLEELRGLTHLLKLAVCGGS